MFRLFRRRADPGAPAAPAADARELEYANLIGSASLSDVEAFNYLQSSGLMVWAEYFRAEDRGGSGAQSGPASGASRTQPPDPLT